MEESFFSLAVKDARDGRTVAEVLVGNAWTIAHLKEFLVDRGQVPRAALKTHIAHGGRLLQEDELLAAVRAVPVVVLAVIMPAPATRHQPPNTIAATSPEVDRAARPNINRAMPAVQPLRPALALPSAGEIAAAWERAFPSGGGELATPGAARLNGGDSRDEDENEDDERLCRICFCGDECGKLIAPCRCRGSVRFVHAACLNEWRVASANPRAFHRCDQCGYVYRTRRTALAAWLQDERVVVCAAAAILALLVVAGAMLPGRPERFLYRTLRWNPAATLRHLGWGSCCDALVRGLALPAACGFAQSIHTAYSRHRGIPLEQQSWAAALVLSVAADGVLIARPLLVGGLGFFALRLAAEVRLVCRRLFTRFGEQVLSLG
jgi:hypothetical protein